MRINNFDSYYDLPEDECCQDCCDCKPEIRAKCDTACDGCDEELECKKNKTGLRK